MASKSGSRRFPAVAGDVVAVLFDEIEAKQARCIEPSSLRFLSRLRKAGLVGRRCNGDVVRQRLVVASHQPGNATFLDSRIARKQSARHAARSRTNRRQTLRYGDDHCYALHLYRKETHPEKLREARERSRGAVPAGDPARVVSRVPAGRNADGGAQERRPAGRLHVDLPDLEPLGQRPPRVRELFAARRPRSTSSSASSAA